MIKQSNILVYVRFTTSKAGLDFLQIKLNISVVEKLKTQDLRKLGKIKRILKLSGGRVQCPVSPPEKRLLQ